MPKKQSKTLTLKNKNKIFPKFLSPLSTSSYKNTVSKIETFFGSKAGIGLIIEAVFFCLPELVLECLNRGSRISSKYQS